MEYAYKMTELQIQFYYLNSIDFPAKKKIQKDKNGKDINPERQMPENDLPNDKK